VGGVRVTTRFVADAVVTCDSEGSIHRPGAVDVEDGRIDWVGPLADAPAAGVEEQAVGGILLPGLVNCHCHSPMTLFRGAAEDVTLDRFLREVLWPREAQLTDDDVYWGMTLACAELLRAGVTTSCEMYVHEEPVMRAVVDAGSRCLLTPGVMDVPGWLSWRTRLEEVLGFIDSVHSREDERVELGIAAHAAYTLPVEALDAIAAAALERDLLVHIHVAETREEWTGEQSVPALLAARGFLEARVLAAHSVWLSDEDLDLYVEHDVAVAHCPQSNAKLAAGVARLQEMIDRGLRVGLGTDGPPSNNDLDLWDEVRLAPLLAKLQTGRPEAVPAPAALALATSGGASALGLPAGAIEPGRAADLVRVRYDDPVFVPVLEDRDLVSHLVWSSSSRLVTDVWVAGRQVVRDGVCVSVDLERASREVQARAQRLAAS
jgi:5-methylthioadenosine/S-adenosylhomocysteine deaminase